MTKNKYNRIKKHCITSKFYRTFISRLNDIPRDLLESLTSMQIATLIDGPMQKSFNEGFNQ